MSPRGRAAGLAATRVHVAWSPDVTQFAFVGSPPPWDDPSSTTVCIADARGGDIVRTVDRWGFRVEWSRRDKFAVDWGGDPDTGISVVDAFTGHEEWSGGWAVGGPLDPAWSPDGSVLAHTGFENGHKNWPTSITAIDLFARDAEPWIIAEDGESPAWRP